MLSLRYSSLSLINYLCTINILDVLAAENPTPISVLWKLFF